MALLLISLSAFFASLLTLFSGFGLGTLLMPVVAALLYLLGSLLVLGMI